jgi:hypothetical protein
MSAVIGKASDFKIYNDEVRGGVILTLTQAIDALRAGAAGAINLNTVSRRGDYAKESFFKNIAGLVTRRDTTSVSATDDMPLTMDEIISVKLNRKIGPVSQTRDAFRKVLMSTGEDAFSSLVGQMAGKAIAADMVNTGLRAARAALVNTAGVYYTVPTNGTITTPSLVTGLSKFGDAASNIVAWVMHSKVWFDLVQYQLSPSSSGDNIAGTTLAAASPQTLNRPVIITDSDALAVSSGSGSSAHTDYFTLGLTASGIVLENTETEEVVIDDVTGLENLVIRLQGEYAFNCGLKGFKWDTANGGANPNDSAVGTGTNWDAAYGDVKQRAGIVIQSR